MGAYLERTVNGLIGRHHQDDSLFPFVLGDWDAPSSGLTLSLSGGHLRLTYTLSSGDKVALYNASGQSSLSSMLVFAKTTYNLPLFFGLAAVLNDNETATLDGILAGHPLKFTGSAALNDFAGGTPTTIASQASVNSNGPLPITLWADGTNAWSYNHDQAYSITGAMVNTPQSGYAGIYVAAGASGSINIDISDFVAMAGHLLTVTGLATGQIVRVYNRDGSVVDSATESGGSVTLNLQSAVFWPVGTIAVFESDGTTLVAVDREPWGGDTWELRTITASAISLTNPGAESGNTGWTSGGMSPLPSSSVLAARTGSSGWELNAPVVSAGWRYQDYAIPSEQHALIDGGAARMQVIYWAKAVPTIGGWGRFYVDYYDGTPGSLISSSSVGERIIYGNTPSSVFAPAGFTDTIPAGTRTLRFYIWGFRTGAPTIHVVFDDLESNIFQVSPPQTPTVTVSGVTATSAQITGSAFVAGDYGGSHAETNYWIRKVSDDSLVWSNLGATGGELITDLAGGLPQATQLYAEMQYEDSLGNISDIGTSAPFTTLTLAGCQKLGQVDDDDPQLTKIGLVTPDPWGNYAAIGNPVDGYLIAFQQGSLVAPRAIVLNQCRPHDEGRVTLRGGFDGEVAASYHNFYNFKWANYWSIENSGMGACVLASGEYGNALNPLTGIFAFLTYGFSWPYGSCGGPDYPGQTWAGSSYATVVVFENDSIAKVVSVVADPVTPLRAINRGCSIFQDYGLRLQATKDYIGDPTGRTWDIKFQFEDSAIPDGSTWTIETSHTSEILQCGLGGPAVWLVPGATLGPSGAIFFYDITVENLAEFCEPGDDTETTLAKPTVTAEATCGFISALGYGWSGPSVGTVTEAKWDVRTSPGGSLLYTTGWQSEQLRSFRVNLYDEPAIPQNTAVDVQVTFRDAALNESTISDAVVVTTGRPPDSPTLTIDEFYANRVIVTVSDFSSPDPSATHEVTSFGVFLSSDTAFASPVAILEATTPETLTGQFNIEGTFDPGETYTVRVIFTDQYGCTSTALTEGGAPLPEGSNQTVAPAKACPTWESCQLGAEASWVACNLPADATFLSGDLDTEATWDTDPKEQC